MKLTVIVCLLMFYSFSDAALANMLTINGFVKKIPFISKWNQSNDTYYNPDIDLNTLEIIRRTGYPAEAHVITTEDGYLLTLHRIPGGNDSLPVLLQHGLLCTSADWVILGKGKALAYLLADQGYDVWLGNFRGNTYSRAHISLSPSNSTFWDFSFHEMGIYDLSAMIKFITNMRSQPLHTYIGHSMGTSSFYVMASERPEIAQKVQIMISLAPAAFIDHMKSPIKYLIPLSKLKMLLRYFFHDEVLPQNFFLKFLTKYGCNKYTIEKKICANIIFMICGYDREQFDYNLLPVILNHDPAGTSSKTLLHFGQELKSGRFCQYDYGREKNLLKYHSPVPPNYNLANITVPIALIYGSGDWIINIADVKRLSQALPNVVDIYEVPWPKFNHVDFLWAKDAPKLIYDKILKLIERKNVNNVTSTLRR